MSKPVTKKILRDLIADVFNQVWQEDDNEDLMSTDVSNLSVSSDTELEIYSNNQRFVVKIIKPRQVK